MRHQKKGKKFHRMRGQRVSFLRNLGNDLIRAGRMTTTEARAKAVRPLVERLVTFAKRNTLATRRVLISRVHDDRVVHKLMHDIAPRYADRNGGYTRIIKLGQTRKRDGTRLTTIEFV